MPRTAKATSSDVHTRRAIVELLKQQGPQDAQSLADQIDISAMAVRQHLYMLRDERLVTYQLSQRSRGRPAKLWQLTAAANRLFPDAHAELAVDLVSALGAAFGVDGLDRLLAIRTQQQIQTYQEKMPKRASLKRRLQALAEIRTEEGYMAEVIGQGRGACYFVENHCPICAAAAACTGLCGAELDVFQAVLGEAVEITRTEHIVAGGRRCAYEVRRR